MNAKKYDTPHVVMENEKQQSRRLLAAREVFAKKRNMVVNHAPNTNVDLTSPSRLIKARIEFTQNRIEINHLLTDIIEKRLGKNKNPEVQKVVAKLSKLNSENVLGL